MPKVPQLIFRLHRRPISIHPHTSLTGCLPAWYDCRREGPTALMSCAREPIHLSLFESTHPTESFNESMQRHEKLESELAGRTIIKVRNGLISDVHDAWLCDNTDYCRVGTHFSARFFALVLKV